MDKILIFSYVFTLFVCITYTFSFFEKCFDYSNTKQWLENHFQKSIIKKYVSLGLNILLLAECITMLLSFYALYSLFFYKDLGAVFLMNIANIFCLFLMLIGQRFAKDFDGARTIVIYFIPSLLAIFFL